MNLVCTADDIVIGLPIPCHFRIGRTLTQDLSFVLTYSNGDSNKAFSLTGIKK
jgi:hypothetical protein